MAGFVLTPTTARAQLRLSGQVGFRAEYMGNENFAENDATRDDDHRMRWRARVRLAGNYAVSERVGLGFRLSTGSTTYPSSGWSTLGDDFRRDQISLDRAYLDYEASELLSLHFGFNGNALFRPTELVWDGDVSPGGFTQVWTSGGVELVTGQYMLRELRSLRPTREESSYFLANGLSYRWGEGASYRLGAFSYIYTNPNSLATAIEGGQLDSDFKTNRFAPDDPEAFFSDYDIYGGSFSYSRGDWAFASEVSVNLGAEDDATLGEQYADKEHLAFVSLITYGSLGDPGSWNITAGYAHIEADGLVAAFNSDDLQQTNVNTVPIWVRAQLPGDARLVWDTYVQSKADEALASNGGIFHDENATKIRTRLTIQANF
ncbi:MAG: putative porin [Gemmatimonadota bacterium]